MHLCHNHNHSCGFIVRWRYANFKSYLPTRLHLHDSSFSCGMNYTHILVYCCSFRMEKLLHVFISIVFFYWQYILFYWQCIKWVGIDKSEIENWYERCAIGCDVRTAVKIERRLKREGLGALWAHSATGLCHEYIYLYDSLVPTYCSHD